LGGRKGIWPVKKTEWWGAGVAVCLERGADLHMAQLMPLPLTVSCFSKIQIGFTFLEPAYPGSPRQRAVKWVCVLCVCINGFLLFVQSLSNAKKVHAYVRDADDTIEWIEEKDLLVSSEDYGHDVVTVQAMIVKHEGFEVSREVS